jgi:hypothetical protein
MQSDPIFAVIERFNGVNDRMVEISKLQPVDANGDLASGTPEYKKWEKATGAR